MIDCGGMITGMRLWILLVRHLESVQLASDELPRSASPRPDAVMAGPASVCGLVDMDILS